MKYLGSAFLAFFIGGLCSVLLLSLFKGDLIGIFVFRPSIEVYVATSIIVGFLFSIFYHYTDVTKPKALNTSVFFIPVCVTTVK